MAIPLFDTAPGASDAIPPVADVSRPWAQPLRVMHVVFGLQPGGMEFGVVKLVNGLDRTRIRSSICSTRPPGSMKSLVACDVPVFELQRRQGNDPAIVWALASLFRRERPHVVHTHAWGTLLEGLIAARLARVPLVVHGEHGSLQLRAYQRWLQRAGWSSADCVVSVSSRLAERMSRETRFPAGRIRTIRNGVDVARFGVRHREDARRALNISDDALVIGTAGRLVPVKDQLTLLRAVARVRAMGLAVTLLLAGDGPLKGMLEETAQALGIRDHVRFLGHCPDVPHVLAALDVFALSSISEGLSNTILEAMATGLPVVATRVGGADELVEDTRTGLLVPAGAPDAFAGALAQLLADEPRRQAMGAAARQRAELEFNLPDAIRAYEALYLQLAATRLPALTRDTAEVL